MQSNNEHLNSSQVKSCLSLFGDSNDFCKIFNPKMITKYACQPDACINGKAPTLNTAKKAYGIDMMIGWLILQINYINDMAGVTTKMNEEQIENVAQNILSNTDFSSLKVTDIMLFINNLLSGKYGCFYGCVDGMFICNALYKYKQWKMQRLGELQLELQRLQRLKEFEEWEKFKQGEK